MSEPPTPPRRTPWLVVPATVLTVGGLIGVLCSPHFTITHDAHQWGASSTWTPPI
jgi:hypothetical protein